MLTHLSRTSQLATNYKEMPTMHANTNTTTSSLMPMSFEYEDTYVQLEILQNAFKVVLGSAEMQEADLPMLDVLYSLNERFSDLLKHN